LIIRGLGEINPDLKNALLNFILWRGIFDPAHFIMERKMMPDIKQSRGNACSLKLKAQTNDDEGMDSQ
jgi:hypothetical protein